MVAFSPTLVGVFEAVSVGSLKYEGRDIKPDSARSADLMERPGGPDDPYGGWKQVDSVRGAEEVVLPEGVEDDEEGGVAVGYEDEHRYRVEMEDGVLTISRA